MCPRHVLFRMRSRRWVEPAAAALTHPSHHADTYAEISQVTYANMLRFKDSTPVRVMASSPIVRR